MKFRSLTSSLAAILLTGCAISAPTTKPNSSVSDVVAERDYYVVVTHATLTGDRANRRTFYELSGEVADSLESTPGIVNFSRRANLLTDEAWTLTVWEDRQAVDAFKINPSHITAMSKTGELLSQARFARFVVKGADLPVSWELALEQLETQNQGYETAYGG